MSRPRLALLATVLVAAAVVEVSGRQQAVFRGGTRAVAVDVAVKDGNRPVLDLTASDFVLFDNDVRQTIDFVSIDAVPVDVTVFLGSSDLSSVDQLGDLSADARRIAALLRPNDRVRLLTLANQVTDVFGWRAAADPAAAIDVRVGGVQTLADAMFIAMMHRPDPDRRHLIVAITDGVDFGSVLDSATVRDVARRAEAVLHLAVVTAGGAPQTGRLDPRRGFTTPRHATAAALASSNFGFLRATWFHVLPEFAGLSRLEEGAHLTGGTVRTVPEGTSVVDTFRRAFEDFRQSYLLLYAPSGVPADGWHELRVELTGNRNHVVRARRGYFGG